MPIVDKEMVCPGCGASISSKDKVCESCGRKLVFTSLNFKAIRQATFKDSSKFLESYQNALKDSPNNPNVLASLGYVLLDRGQFSDAAESLNKAMSNGAEDSDVVFHAALAQYKSKKPFQIKLKEAEDIIAKLDIAITMDPKPQYFLVKSELIKTLFERRFIKYKESSSEVMNQSYEAGLTAEDKTDIESLLMK